VSNDPLRPVEVARLRSEADAALLIARLELEGIKAMSGGAGTSTGWPEAMGDVKVMVRYCDLERARRIRGDLAQQHENLR
jgi:hypothetical protein